MNRPNYKGYGDLSSKHWSRIKYRAFRDKREFDISIEYAWDLFISQNKKCALSGLDIVLSPSEKFETTASLDRMDSSLGYIYGNIQWLHKSVNNLKGIMSNRDCISLCLKIVENNLE